MNRRKWHHVMIQIIYSYIPFFSSLSSLFFCEQFQRQLNLYGFNRIQHGNCKGGYKHKFFRRGQRTMCQLIARCAARDKDQEDSTDYIEKLARSGLITKGETGSKNKSIVDDGGNNVNSNNNINSDNMSYDTLNVPTNVSISSNELSNVVLPMVPTSTAASSRLLAGHHQATAAMIAERQHNIDAAITNISNFQMMADSTSQRLQIEKYRQEHQQLQQLRAQQFSLQQLRNQQKREAVLATLSVEAGHTLGMAATVAGMNHSSSVGSGGGIARQVTINAGEDIKNHSTSGGSSSNTCGTSHFTPNSTPRSPELDKNNVILHKEFQFPWKLFEMLERCEVDGFSNMVSWMPGETCFRVHDTDNFVREVMSMFFKQTKYKR